jgi:catechol 2,3-dioxygenase-like lactoylglutathione lyase family enzyme
MPGSDGFLSCKESFSKLNPGERAAYADRQKIGNRYLAFIAGSADAGDDAARLILSYGGSHMKQYLILGLAMVGLMAGAGVLLTRAATEHTHQSNAFTPDTIPWGPAPPVVRPGAQFAVLEGDPTATTGDFTVRLKMPDGFRIAPHFHPNRENVTVISGTFKLGMGDEFEANKMKAFTAGSFAFLDPDMHHFAMACGETIVQVHGHSPLQFNYVNPEDDPSRSR